MRKFILFSAVALITTSFNAALASGPNKNTPDNLTISVALHSLKNDKLLYNGERKQVKKDGVVSVKSVYTDMNGKVLDNSEVSYEEESLRVLSSKSEDLRFGAKTELTLSGDSMRIYYKEDSKSAAKTETVKWGAETATSSTVTELIIHNWVKLASGKAVELDLVVASRQETIRFRLMKDKQATLGGKSMMVIRMEPNSWIIRKLVDPMYFYLSEEMPHRLVEYHGRSSIKTEDGKDQDLRMVFTYK